MECHLEICRGPFLGGLSLHLNHLIESGMRISYRSFGTLPIGIFFSNLGSRQLETSPRTLSGQFWHMPSFGNSRAIRVLMPKYRVSENQFFLDEGATTSRWGLGVLGGQMAGLYGGTIFGGSQDTWRLWLGFKSEGSAFRWFNFILKPPYTIAIGNFFSAIWDTSHWNFFVKFCLKTAYNIYWNPF